MLPVVRASTEGSSYSGALCTLIAQAAQGERDAAHRHSPTWLTLNGVRGPCTIISASCQFPC